MLFFNNMTLTGNNISSSAEAEAGIKWLEDVASNCSLRLEHIEKFNVSQFMLMRLYNLCEHTWDPSKTWEVYYWGELIPPLIIYSLTLLLGVIGNLLIIVSITGYRSMKSPTNIFLASLAFADLILCVVCLPIKLAELFSFTWTFGLFLCKFVNYMQYISAVASVLNLTVMSLERCYAIVYPLKAKSICTVSKAQRVVFGVWVSAFFLATPILFIQPVKYNTPVSRDKDMKKTSNPWIPINAEFKVQKQSLQKFRRVIRMLAAIVVVFVLCWSPFLVMNIFRSFGVVNISLHGFVKYANTTFTLMAYLNSALNPIIYGFMSQNFRDNFRRTVGCLKSRDEIEANQMNSLNLGKLNRKSSIKFSRTRVPNNSDNGLPLQGNSKNRLR
ncbi:G-protein coupled receptor 54-like [Lepeophtheirus salmonis]|uniref:G-protein coupled receptor 54-like n=1 Tax=Lepeophtheirus salmonis TaxID=72036 RepID=UPI003AF33D66